MNGDTVTKNSIEQRDTFALKFDIDWEYVDVIRSFVNSFLQKALIDNARSDKVAMAVSELLENAVKYGDQEKNKRLNNIHIQLDTFKDNKMVVFFIENTSKPENIEVLKEQLKIVNKGNPKEMFVSKIKQSLLSEDKSQLGLARIRYEAGGKIFLEIKKGNRVRLKVVFDITV
jgi:anti-sigma regulatory factor (Ser/Thr protein kinase)